MTGVLGVKRVVKSGNVDWSYFASIFKSLCNNSDDKESSSPVGRVGCKVV